MHGYCLALEGKNIPAVRAFEESINRNPHYFWSYYNLGVLHLQAGEWESAQEAFQSAAAVNPATTAKIIFASKVFQQLLAQVDSPQQVIPAGLKAGYQDCHRWIAVIDHLKALGQKELPSQFYNQLRVRIF
ncbi:MAG: tetratricopeptide repeat protein [Candidatus Omnitrophica bacterium]|nr:tetratricopeptide repeat protein [Candidatus Omnitrophota bacterium]